MQISGRCITFGEVASLGNHNEVINSGALDGVNLEDIFLIYNHDATRVPLAKSPATMQLTLMSDGLYMSAELPETEEARGIYEACNRGDLSGFSFGFEVAEDEWQGNLRIIKKISRVLEISITPWPVYKTTKILEVRSMDFENMSLEELKAALEAETDEEIKKKIEEEIAKKEGQSEEKKEPQPEQRSFNPITSTRRATFTRENVFESAEYRSAFFKNILGQPLTGYETSAFNLAKSERRADAYNTATSAAAVLPTQTLNEVISKARGLNNLVSHARLFNIPAKLSVPVATPASRATWHTEGSEITREANSLSSVNFDSFELMQIFSLSLKVQKTSIASFSEYLTSELSNNLFDTIDYAAINGTGENQPKGILKAITWDSTNTVTGSGDNGEITYSDLCKAAALLKAGYANGAAWAMSNKTLYTQVIAALDKINRPLYVDPQEADLRKILGLAVILDDNVPDDTIILGNFEKYLGLNIPEGILIESSRESGFTRGVVDIRGLAIADVKPIINEAFVQVKCNS